MRRLGQRDLKSYLSDDWVAAPLADPSCSPDGTLTSQQWLRQSSAKRCVFAAIYGDPFEHKGWRILDVGGGLSSWTRNLAKQHHFELVDIMVHDHAQTISRFRNSCPDFVMHQSDWSDLALQGRYDVVLANDLFPNVDQRVAEFLAKMLPATRQVRLSLTYYNQPLSYKVKRLDADELFSILAYDGKMTNLSLSAFRNRIYQFDNEAFKRMDDCIFPNRRQICIATFVGDLHGESNSLVPHF